MNVFITKGTIRYINDCEEALTQSELGKRYFIREGSAKAAIQEGIEKETLYVALHGDICVGFFYYIPNGAFHAFTCLHLISVKKEYRSRGIGKKMLEFLENNLLLNTDKVFFVVADFNPDAKRFYERLGYCQVGEVPNLYRQGIREYIMMKELGNYKI